MHAAILSSFGIPEFGEFREPQARPGFEVVRVRAAAPMRALGATLHGYTPATVPADARRAAYLRLIDWAVTGRLHVEFDTVPLREVARIWPRERSSRRKLVLLP